MPAPSPASERRALCDHAGWAWVKRRALGKRRQHWLRLTGAVLTAHAGPKAPIEWDVSVAHAVVSPPRRRRALCVVIALDSGVVLHLSVAERDDAQVWARKLEEAAGRVFEDVYQMGEKIGEGAFASVYCATNIASGQVFAVKRIRKKQFDMQMARELEREMYAMKATRHEGVVRTHDVYNTPDKVLLVLDLMKGGTLKDNIQAEGGRIPEQHAVDIVRQVLHALHYLHAQGIVHRDIKLENILCETNNIPVGNIRVADFGYVNFVADHADYSLRSLVGTPVYVAPEIVSRQPYGAPVDMYAVGVMLYRMLSGSYPFDAGEDDQETMAMAVQGRLTFDEPAWADTSIMCKNFVRALLQPRPERRLTAKAALHHPWIEGATTTDEEQLATSPVTPYSNPSSVKKNTADIMNGDDGVLGRAHEFGSPFTDTDQKTSQKMSNESGELGGWTNSVLAQSRWKKAVIACIFLGKLRVASGFRPLSSRKVLYRRKSGRPDIIASPGSPPSMRRRMASVLRSGGRRPPRNYQEPLIESVSPSLGDRIRRTLSFSRG